MNKAVAKSFFVRLLFLVTLMDVLWCIRWAQYEEQKLI